MSDVGSMFAYRAWLNRQLVRFACEASFGRLFRAIKSLGGHYSPDQPRDWHGRWTIDGSEAGLADASPLEDFAGVGHHYVNQATFKKYPLSDEARKVFEKATTGALKDPSSNRNDQMHRNYNDAVDEAFRRYMSRNEIQPERMTADQAEKFVDEVKRSSEPRIRSLNQRVWMREIMRSLRLFRGRE